MEQTLRVAFAGFGAVARVHCEAYRSVAGITVVAAADPDPKQRGAAADFGLHTYPNLQQMVRSESPDIVCVAAPAAAHEELVIECADAGVHVLCEKPLALSVSACERMIRACSVRSVRLCYGASYRYLPAVEMARQIIHSGVLGEILLLRESAVGGRGAEYRGTLSSAHYPAGGPGGSGMGLCDHGIHLIDTFSWLLDSTVVRAQGRGNISGAPQRTEFAHIEYANGALAELLYEDGTYSTDLPGEGLFGWAGGWGVGSASADTRMGSWQPHPGCIHVHGTRGSLRTFYYANALFHRDALGVRQVRLSEAAFPANFSGQIAAFAHAIRSGSSTPVPGESGLEAWRTVERIYAPQSPKGVTGCT